MSQGKGNFRKRKYLGNLLKEAIKIKFERYLYRLEVRVPSMEVRRLTTNMC